ncbi:MAG: hypothetical protein SGI72_07995 [Planctomycetota bacterium]|nr:hypothetical protein [Planctomycetota bacterium]
MRSRFLSAALALLALAVPGFAGAVGKTLSKVELEGFTQTKATSYDDMLGRTVLIEFFAYW